ncbi:MAG: hypothetical protein R3C18_25160 [Planctomycetaceae bacterium]
MPLFDLNSVRDTFHQMLHPTWSQKLFWWIARTMFGMQTPLPEDRTNYFPTLAILDSMTKAERANPYSIGRSQVARIAAGSGTEKWMVRDTLRTWREQARMFEQHTRRRP